MKLNQNDTGMSDLGAESMATTGRQKRNTDSAAEDTVDLAGEVIDSDVGSILESAVDVAGDVIGTVASAAGDAIGTVAGAAAELLGGI